MIVNGGSVLSPIAVYDMGYRAEDIDEIQRFFDLNDDEAEGLALELEEIECFYDEDDDWF